MSKNINIKVIASFLTVAWITTVLGSYYFYNISYYQEKVSVFWGFLSRFVG